MNGYTWFFFLVYLLLYICLFSGLCNYRSAQQRTYNIVTEHPLLSSTSTMAAATTPSASIVSSMAQHLQLKSATAMNGQQVSWHRSYCVLMICLFNECIYCYFFQISLSLSIYPFLSYKIYVHAHSASDVKNIHIKCYSPLPQYSTHICY